MIEFQVTSNTLLYFSAELWTETNVGSLLYECGKATLVRVLAKLCRLASLPGGEYSLNSIPRLIAGAALAEARCTVSVTEEIEILMGFYFQGPAGHLVKPSI